MATTLTPIALVRDTALLIALTALGTAGTDETFELTPGVPCDRIVLIFDNAATNTELAVSISAGDYWQASLGANAFVVAVSTQKILVLTGARHKDKDDNKITIVMNPDGAADAAALLGAYQLPPAGLLSGV